MIKSQEKILNYTVENKLWTGVMAIIFQIVHEKSLSKRTLKVLKEEYPSVAAVEELQREWHISQIWHNLEGILQPQQLLRQGHVPFLIMEDFHGQSLRSWLKEQKQIDLYSLLHIGMNLAHIIESLHGHGIIHGYLATDQLLFDPSTKRVKLAEYSQVILPGDSLPPPPLPLATLPYAAPERSGRVHAVIDSRTDIYSLGAILYECIAGRPPFSPDNPLSLIHQQLAVEPRSLFEIAPHLPMSLSDVVMHCLTKAPEKRYQTANEVYRLLQWHMELLEAGGEKKLQETQKSIYTPLSLTPKKLYGRKQIETALLHYFNAVLAGSSHWIALIGGQGMGKSALLRRCFQLLLNKSCYLALNEWTKEGNSAKDPGATLRLLLRDIFKQVAGVEEALWLPLEDSIATACAGSEEAIIDFIPEIASLLHRAPPSSPPAGNCPPYTVIERIITALTATAPVVLLIDNIDLIDSDSLQLLGRLIRGQGCQRLLLISSQQLPQLAHVYPSDSFTLQPLSLEQICSFFSELFALPYSEVTYLGELVWRKTEGTPFFVGKFLQELLSEEIVWYNFSAYRWQWNIEQVRKKTLTENVFLLLQKKIAHLPDPCRSLLALCAQLGFTFHLSLLSHVARLSSDHCLKILWPAATAGLIEASDKHFASETLQQLTNALFSETDFSMQFTHNLLYEKAYELVGAEEKHSIHRIVGNYLLKKQQQKENVGDILLHFNQAILTFQSAEERVVLAELNLQGSLAAKQVSNIPLAFRYITIARNLLDASYWNSHYQLTYEIYLESAQISYLMRRLDQIEPLSNIILSHANSPLDKGRLYTWKVNYYTNCSRHKEAIATGLECLRLFGIDLPENPPKWLIFLRLLRSTFYLRKKGLRKLYQLPPMKDTTALFLLEHFGALCPACFIINKPLLCLLSLMMIELSLKKGNCAPSSFAYTAYAVSIATVFGAYRKALSFGELSVYLANRFDSDVYRCRTNFVTSLLLSHWIHPRKQCKHYLDASHLAGMACNDALFLSYIIAQYGFLDGIFYKKIGQAASYVEKYREEVALSKNPIIINQNLIQERLCELLQSPQGEERLLYPSSDEVAFAALLHNDPTQPISYQIYVSYEGMMLFLFGQYNAAWQLYESSKDNRECITTMPREAEVLFFHAMTAACLLRMGQHDRLLWHTLHLALRRFRQWSSLCPANYGARYTLLEAQRAWLHRSITETERLFNQALQLAQKEESTLDEALANEQLALLFFKENILYAAAAHLREAHYCYYRWGCTAKLKQLEKLYPTWLTARRPETQTAYSLKHPYTHSLRLSQEEVANELTELHTLQQAAELLASYKWEESSIPALLLLAKDQMESKQITLLTKEKQQWITLAHTYSDNSAFLANPNQKEFSSPLWDLFDRAVSHHQLLSYPHSTTVAPPEGAVLWDLCLPIFHGASSSFLLYFTECPPIFQKKELSFIRLLIPHGAMTIENILLCTRLSEVTNKLKTFQGRLENYTQKLEQQVEEGTRELQGKNEQLQLAFEQTQQIQQRIIEQEKLTTIGSLAQDVSLEIHAPLSHINILVAQAEEPLRQLHNWGLEGEELLSSVGILQQNVQKIREHSLRAQAVIDMLHFSPEEGTFLPRNVEGLLEEVIAWSERLFAAQSDTSLHIVRLGCTLQRHSTAYYPDLRHALLNMLDNACYAMQKKQEAVGIAYTPTITIVTSEARKDWIEITIQDNGVGIATHLREKVFFPFFTTKPPGSGHGLGLSTSYDIITHRCKGELSFRSQEDSYTAFTIALPIPH